MNTNIHEFKNKIYVHWRPFACPVAPEDGTGAVNIYMLLSAVFTHHE